MTMVMLIMPAIAYKPEYDSGYMNPTYDVGSQNLADVDRFLIVDNSKMVNHSRSKHKESMVTS